jgi:hypothetical protein
MILTATRRNYYAPPLGQQLQKELGMDLQTFTTAALLTFALVTGQNLIRYAKELGTAEGRNGVLGIGLAWAMGFGIAWWAAQAAVTAKLELVDGAGPLGKMDMGSLLLLGLALGSAGSQFVDFLKSRDNTQSASKPKLVGPSNGAVDPQA